MAEGNTQLGFDPLRPFRYALDFIGGTITGGLDGIAEGGRWGGFLGMIAGAVAVVLLPATAVGGMTLLGGAFCGGLFGLVGGAAVGGVLHTATDGVKEVEKDDAQEHKAAAVQAAHASKAAPNKAADKAPDKAAEQAKKAERRAAAIANYAEANPPKNTKPNHFQDQVKAGRAASAQGDKSPLNH